MKKTKKALIFRYILSFIITGVASAAVLWVVAWLFLPDVSGKNQTTYTPEQIQAAEKARDVSFDPDNLPVLHVKVDYSEGAKARWYPKGESPILAKLVKDGKLPPVAERVGPEPCVMRGCDGIGKYGGTWLRIATNPGNDIGVITWRMSAATAMRWSPLGYPIVPHVLKSLESRNGNREFILTLRKGVRWSDGHPLTADDIMYWWNHEFNDEVVYGTMPDWMKAGYMTIAGKRGTVKKIDDFSVKFSFPAPHALFPGIICRNTLPILDYPAHYLKQYHPNKKIGDEEICEKAMKAYKLPSRSALYTYMKHYQNPEHPRLWPWIYRTYKPTPPQVFVRNPYYFVVDTEGNQLPYVDRVQFDVISDDKMLALAATEGRITMQTRHISYDNYTELMSRRKEGGYRVLHWYSADRGTYIIQPNQNRLVDPDRPDTKWKAKYLADKRFRQALSLAINRRQIIKAEANNQTEPSQAGPSPESIFYHEGLIKAFTQYDPERANRILDEIGLDQRDSEGFRTFPDGTRIVFYHDTADRRRAGITEFVIADWLKVGVRVIPRERSRRLFYVRKDSREFDFNVWGAAVEHMAIYSPRFFIPLDTESFYAVGWARWYMKGGFYGSKAAAESPSAIPVPKDSPMYHAIAAYEKARQASSIEEQVNIFKEVLDIAAENTWSIGISTSSPDLAVVKDGFRNVPERVLTTYYVQSPGNAGIETYFFEKPKTSPAIDQKIAKSLMHATLRPGGKVDEKAGPSSIGKKITSFIKYSVLVGMVLVVVLISLRHPYIFRRLLIMAPTLLIISVVVFTVIQLPPGDFLTAKLMQLQVSGDAQDLQMIEDLRTQFHFDEPNWKRYCRWMGVYWFSSVQMEKSWPFFSANEADEGLLQGNMGRSMETTQEVNEMIGDRLLLTVLISLGTIMFTWVVAIPIGIFSAVRQYSIGDYALTFLGFVGMCIPPFLLALILMALSGVSGLFSAEYAAQPDWDWPKVLDLLKHIWIPVIVLGVGGTAGMIRVMRANLLDELKKPYVVTARAKGVRPIKLLFKYPVRMALNPFISGIGGLFPQLVSGGAIVAMVLALPTVGPLLLDALFNEDMYLAGSMLMVLSLLGVLGTLVSDLLLLWLDPRIRFKGGSR